MFTPTPRVSVEPITTRTASEFMESAISLRFSLLVLPSTTAICSRGMPCCTRRSTMSRTVEKVLTVRYTLSPAALRPAERFCDVE